MYGEGAWERATNPVPFVPGCRPLIYFSIWDKVRVTELYSTSTISVLTAYKHPVSLSSAYLHNNPRLYIRNITKHKNTENTKFVYTKIWVHLVLWFIMIYWNEPRLQFESSAFGFVCFEISSFRRVEIKRKSRWFKLFFRFRNIELI